MSIIPGHFDNPPSSAITAEQVREKWQALGRAVSAGIECAFYVEILEALLAHPGVSSSARAVIEEALR